MMTYRQRMLATLRGQPVDCLPFVPRLDLWYKANKYNGTLPRQYRSASLLDIVEDLDIGYHTVVPDYQDYVDPLDVVDRALGMWRIKHMPFRTELKGIRRNICYDGDTTAVEYLTPAGAIKTRTVYNKSMRQAGITLSHVLEHAIKSVEDYEAVGYIYEQAEPRASYEGLAELKEEIGERGLVGAIASMGASPMHEILHELMTYDQFFYAYYDQQVELTRLAERMAGYYRKVIDLAIASPADFIRMGTNYDAQITWPVFMDEYVAPYLAAAADKIHAASKFLLTHTAGENKKLLPFFAAGHIDIADSICPAPLTSLTLKQVRDFFEGSGITIWGGVASVAVLENSMSDYEFARYLDDLFQQIGKGDHLILSIADTAPPDMKFSRLERIAKLAKEFGPVAP
ncbi:hypothetical protein [Sporomusa sp.]|uniref:hypothetical protein n=1 Tax=Sporomusa sp. TaxID=2078658 RepID=UPI002BA6D37C|nr:hypothetical protein [Sporomusa sp.]HWR43390.1 hypothetical protein [Sporomusa sp.]